MFAIGTGGAATNPKHQARAAGVHSADHHHQRLRLVGDRQHGLRAQPARRRTPTPSSCATADWCSPRTTRGSSSPARTKWAGWRATAASRSATSTTRTPPARPSRRSTASGWSISGDRASLDPDGTLRLFGRDSLVVNTGGEKVFVEEVEEVLRAHPGVVDALVVGRTASGGARRSWHSSKSAPGGDGHARGAARRTASRTWRGSRRPRSSSSSTRCAGSATARPTTAGRRTKRLGRAVLPT